MPELFGNADEYPFLGRQFGFECRHSDDAGQSFDLVVPLAERGARSEKRIKRRYASRHAFFVLVYTFEYSLIEAFGRQLAVQKHFYIFYNSAVYKYTVIDFYRNSGKISFLGVPAHIFGEPCFYPCGIERAYVVGIDLCGGQVSVFAELTFVFDSLYEALVRRFKFAILPPLIVCDHRQHLSFGIKADDEPVMTEMLLHVVLLALDKVVVDTAEDDVAVLTEHLLDNLGNVAAYEAKARFGLFNKRNIPYRAVADA